MVGGGMLSDPSDFSARSDKALLATDIPDTFSSLLHGWDSFGHSQISGFRIFFRMQ